MKVFIVVLFFVAVFYPSQQSEKNPEYEKLFRESVKSCADENKVDPSTVTKVWTDPDYPENNKPLQCFYSCLHTKLDITDENGSLNDGELQKVFQHYDMSVEVSEVSEDCKNVKPKDESDLCEAAYLLVKCVAQKQSD